jgi:hypothetical protein
MNALEAPPTIVLWFILAIVIGYFGGRTASILRAIRKD